VRANDERRGSHAYWGADNLSAEPRLLPPFKHDPPFVHTKHSGRILLDDKVFHKIEDTAQFYEILGHKPSVRLKDSYFPLFAEEFMWDRYRSDGAKMSKQCLNLQIAVYLDSYSERFKEFFATSYVAMIGNCSLECVGSGDQHCTKCPMHPNK
jgi:hypothetical protein